ncbi:MAG: DUF2085 domain-containing protein [Coriobacteriia bacterium]
MLQSLLAWFGYGLCHQIPERSFFGGGVQVPVCARDTGIYLGLVISLVLISRLHRHRHPTGFPSPGTWALLALMVGVMVLDGVTEYVGLRPTTNDLRLFTGLTTGFAAGAILLPMLNDVLWLRRSEEKILQPTRSLALWLLAVPLAFAFIRWVAPLLGVVYPLLVTAVIMAALASINLIIVCTLPPFERRATRLRDAWAALLVAFGIALFEIWMAGVIRHGLEALVTRFT